MAGTQRVEPTHTRDRAMNRAPMLSLSLLLTLSLTAGAHGQDALIRVRADRLGPEVSREMTGVCIEDVNHEIYGGIYSQMVFGESFQEPPAMVIEGFASYGGAWAVEGGVVCAPAGDGPKLVAGRPVL